MINLKDDTLESFHTPVHPYLDSKIDFEEKIRSNEWKSMECYLSFYNKLDVSLLLNAYSAFVNLFIENFDISPLDYISMPTLASKISWQSYSKDCYAIFSFSSDYGFLNADIRRYGLQGGLVSMYFSFWLEAKDSVFSDICQKHVACNSDDDSLLHEVRYAPCGKLFNRVIGFDCNGNSFLKNNHLIKLSIIRGLLKKYFTNRSRMSFQAKGQRCYDW